jgi:hypothetical protein
MRNQYTLNSETIVLDLGSTSRMPMKLNDKISWLMGRVQKSLLPHLNECFDTPLTEQEERLVSTLEIVQVEKYVSNRTTYQWRGRKPLDRQSLARAFVAKSLYRIPTTSVFYAP